MESRFSFSRFCAAAGVSFYHSIDLSVYLSLSLDSPVCFHARASSLSSSSSIERVSEIKGRPVVSREFELSPGGGSGGGGSGHVQINPITKEINSIII